MIPKTYVYKVYRGGQFISTLKNVASKFEYSQNLNTAGAELTIELANKFSDAGAVVEENLLVDESGNFIVDENNFNILLASTNEFNTIPLDLGNEVQVYMFSEDYPNGLKVFTGLISGFVASHKNNNLQIKVLSYGVQLSNYLLNSDPTGQTISQALTGVLYGLGSASKGVTANTVAQSFNIASPAVVGSMDVHIKTVGNPGAVAYLKWALYSGTPASPGPLVQDGDIFISGNIDQFVPLGFTASRTLSGDYYILFYNVGGNTSSYSSPSIGANNTNPYAGGSVYTATDVSNPTWVNVPGNDLAFRVNSASGSNQLTFTNTDPAGIIRRCIDQLAAQGGRVTYTTTSIEDTNTSSSYTFKVATILDAIKSALSLSPAGFYWYIDPATNIFYLKKQGNTADHRLLLGQQLEELELGYTLENVRNVVVFSGGDSGSGENVYVISANSTSKANYGQWLEKISDNRVTADDEADTINNNFLNANSEPAWRTSVTIPDEAYNIESFVLGEMTGFGNFNNLIDNLVLQIVGVKYHADYVNLTLGQIPPIATSAYEELNRRLDAQETIDNPDTPT